MFDTYETGLIAYAAQVDDLLSQHVGRHHRQAAAVGRQLHQPDPHRPHRGRRRTARPGLPRLGPRRRGRTRRRDDARRHPRTHPRRHRLRTPRDERGAGYAYSQLVAAGVPAVLPGESGRDYVARALIEGPFRRVRHPGNLAYVWPSATGPRRVADTFPPALPYRKAFDTLIAAPRFEWMGPNMGGTCRDRLRDHHSTWGDA